jgi:guanine deaminase
MQALTATQAIRADLLDFTAEPAWGDVGPHGGTDASAPAGVRWRPDHWLLLAADGRIAGVQHEDPAPGIERHDHRGRLLLPGFIDTHVHSPQVPVLASYGTELLGWLNTYTFPSETAWADEAVARAGTTLFLDALLAHGTTAAVVFPTVHKGSAEALFEGAAARGMRIIGGKVLMDRHAPDGLRDTVASAERDCVDLIQRWHGHARCAYALTVRFAPTSTPEQLALAGALCRADPSLYMQTHVAENRDEVRWVAELFPHARSYLAVYDDAGLLHPRSVLAHGIWLDADDRARLAATGAHIAHSPTSNLFLGSGLYPWRTALQAGHATTLASDVGGGTQMCLLRNAAAAYTVQALQGERLTAWCALHAATRGAAQALRLGHEIGALEPGLMADFTLWDWSAGPLDAERLRVARGLHEKVFAWMTLADERHLAATWVAGQARYTRSNARRTAA